VKRWTWQAVLAAALVAGCSAPVQEPEAQSVVTLAAWGPCVMTESMPDSNGTYPGVECFTLTVSFDYSRPDDPTFRIPVIRMPSKAQEPKLLLTNPGGPGISGVVDLRSNREYFEKFSDAYTVVSLDPRGVGASAPALQCLDDQQRQAIFNQPSAPTSEPDMKRARELATGIGDSCKRQFGDALADVGAADVAPDMDEIRKATGFDQINYLGFSCGIFLGAVYADMFPKQTDRLVLDSVMDPALDYQRRPGAAGGGRPAADRVAPEQRIRRAGAYGRRVRPGGRRPVLPGARDARLTGPADAADHPGASGASQSRTGTARSAIRAVAGLLAVEAADQPGGRLQPE
jgi:pimeloyl-ACP methyl ester carboxylesterase